MLSGCDNRAGFIHAFVTNPNLDPEDVVKYTVKLLRANHAEKPVQVVAVTVTGSATEKVDFEDVAAGDYKVLARPSDGGPETVSEIVSIDRCNEIAPIDDPLQVFVRCENGKGLLTVRVFNTEGEQRTFTVSIDDIVLEDEGGSTEFPIDPNNYVRIEVTDPFPDGSYDVRVVAEGTDHKETVNVACAAPPTTPTTTTTTPAPQARPAASTSGGALASTGAAVGGAALLGVVALALGGGLLIASRRRARPAQGTED